MAAATARRIESRLPTLKCSNCLLEIDIISLPEHVCHQSPTVVVGNNTTRLGGHNGALKSDSTIVPDTLPLVEPEIQQDQRCLGVNDRQPALSFLKTGRNVPIAIDPAAANRPFLQPEASLTPGSDYSSYTNDQGLTPVTPSTQITTPSSMFSWKQSYPSRSPSPPSPAFATNLDSAFPPFRTRYDQHPSLGGQQNFMKPQPSPGANVIQRMNGGANGPFSSQQGRTANSNAPSGPTERRPSDSQHVPLVGIVAQGPYERPSMSQAAQEPTAHVDSLRSETELKHTRSNPRKVVNSIDMFLRDDGEDDSDATVMLSPEQRSRTFPEDRTTPGAISYGAHLPPAVTAAPDQTEFFPYGDKGMDAQRPTTSAGMSMSRSAPKARFDGFENADVQNTFLPASRRRAPSLQIPQHMVNNKLIPITEANSPDHDPKSPWFEAPRPPPVPPAGAMRSKTQSRPSEPTAVERFLNQEPAAALPYHLRTDGSSAQSEISHSSSGSTSSYASSQSTLPSSISSLSTRHPSSDSTPSHGLGISRSTRPEPLPLPSLPAARIPQPLESPIDPAIHHMRAPLDPAVQMGTLPRTLLSDSPPQRLRQGSRPDLYASDPPRFQPPPSKGECRGCGTTIYGKSVKAADGRLPGRYHKECFVCKTCQAPFPSAEFYVHGNAPYCAQHYHELNDSLCTKCDRGIEGRYLETDRREKFHAHCFCCAHCRTKLETDYYEVGGKPYCERHALAIPRSYGLGASAPRAEKRRTRMGFM